MKCQSDRDCPEYSKCENFQCRFGDFICIDYKVSMISNIKEEDEFCYYVNTNEYDIKDEKFYNFNNSTRPILKTCPIFERRCKTETCYSDKDCLSGACSNNRCINSDKINYELQICSPNSTNDSMNCGKVNVWNVVFILIVIVIIVINQNLKIIIVRKIKHYFMSYYMCVFSFH